MCTWLSLFLLLVIWLYIRMFCWSFLFSWRCFICFLIKKQQPNATHGGTYSKYWFVICLSVVKHFCQSDTKQLSLLALLLHKTIAIWDRLTFHVKWLTIIVNMFLCGSKQAKGMNNNSICHGFAFKDEFVWYPFFFFLFFSDMWCHFLFRLSFLMGGGKLGYNQQKDSIICSRRKYW